MADDFVKRKKLQVIGGSKAENSPGGQQSGSSRWEYLWTGLVSGVIWAVIGFWIWKFIAG